MRTPVTELFVRMTAKAEHTTEEAFWADASSVFAELGYVVVFEVGTETSKLHLHARVTGIDPKTFRQRANRKEYKGQGMMSVKVWNKKNTVGMNYMFKGPGRGTLPPYKVNKFGFSVQDAWRYHHAAHDYYEKVEEGANDDYERRLYQPDDRIIQDLCKIFIREERLSVGPELIRLLSEYLITIGRAFSDRKKAELGKSALRLALWKTNRKEFDSMELNGISAMWEQS